MITSQDRLILLLLPVLALWPCIAPAVTIEIVNSGNGLMQANLTDIDQIEGRVYTLDPDAGESVRPAERDNARQRRLVGVRIKPETAMRDASARFHMGGLDHHHPDPGNRELPEMHQMPVGGRPLDRTVLAHRGYGDPVRNLQPAQMNGRKK